MQVRRPPAEVAVDRSPEALTALLDEARLPTDGDLADRRPGGLSGGRRRRVSLARAPARRPTVLLFGEPPAGLDANVRDEIGELLRHLAERHRVVIALCCHDADLVRRLADDVVEPRPRLTTGSLSVPARRSAPPETTGRPAVLAVTGLAAAFTHRGRRIPALHGVDFDLSAGGGLGVAGASGSGKTPLMRTVVGLHRATAAPSPSTAPHCTPSPPAAPANSAVSSSSSPRIPWAPSTPAAPSARPSAVPLALHDRTPRARRDERVLEPLDRVGLPADFATRSPMNSPAADAGAPPSPAPSQPNRTFWCARR
ncbi:ATP-binding cassette domain-containing protein [Streptomyces sp. CC208A]|uniref:ATP-binding cassette domain-containing protein n=1 Tax=Streptomyces sp. CC208A TaxID=3044573 RepID=UPI0024A8C184|nr:ATP-binding cassette domain-containing protein [Streptomyces sp. CC208A]